MAIKNIIFDIGNVLLKWDPKSIIKNTFPNGNYSEIFEKIFKHQLWYNLNLGFVTEKEAIEIYHKQLHISIAKLEELMLNIKNSLTPIEGSIELLETLYQKNYSLYSITDNINELVNHIKDKYGFWDKFKDIIVSAEVHILKPDPTIYLYLLHKHNLTPDETVFIDDHLPNIVSAKALGIHTIHFKDAEKCKEELEILGSVKFSNASK